MGPTIIDLIRGAIVKRRVAAVVVVKANPPSEAFAQLGAAGEGVQVQVLMFDGPPQPLEDLRCTVQQLPLPGGDHCGMHIETTG